ncbi:unnamed protein product [Plutella xylostella]|uniref:(diamondback moth) hypothetical protein n=1 Tax=Plutella xylostella TaxID=51655 RepID=A0A8S4FNA0_PLUXY|nr:unnamed protein product [Plutella xylostella]
MLNTVMSERVRRITNLQLQTHLTSLCITNRDIANLLRMMEAEVPVSEVRELVAPLAKKAEWSKALARAIEDLESVADNAKALGLECAVTVAPCLAYNATQHSGVFWQMCAVSAAQRACSKHRSADIVAAGGRYDVLIDEFCVVSRSVQSASTRQASGAAGCSMSLQRMAAVRSRAAPTDPASGAAGCSMSLQRMAAVAAPADPNPSICVCVWGTVGNSRDGHRAARRAQLARELWAAGHAVCTLECKSATEAHELSGASIVLLDEDNYFCAICWDDNRVREHRLPYIEVLDFVKQKLGSDSVKSPEGNFGRTISWSDESRDRDKSSPNISVTFITSSEKMTRNSRRLCENQINTQITSSLLRLGVTQLSRSRVCVLALACEAACVRSLAANLDLPSHSRELLGAASCTINSFPRRRKIIEETIEELITMTSTQNNQSRASEEVVLYALYSIPDAVCRLLV